MDSACDWTDFSEALVSASCLVIFSSSVSNCATTCSHVANDGGAWAVLSCSPKTASFLSAAMDGSCHALCTDGRSVDWVYHLAWVFGSARNWVNFQAVSRCLEFLKTTKSEPPTKDEEVFFVGMGATAYLSLKPAPPTFSTADIIHGPEMNIGTLPLAKSGSVVGVAGAALSEMPSSK